MKTMGIETVFGVDYSDDIFFREYIGRYEIQSIPDVVENVFYTYACI